MAQSSARSLASLLKSDFIREYGMIFVLLLLCAGFSLKIDKQFPGGASAGRDVAAAILNENGSPPNVIVIAGGTGEDLEFTTAARERLEQGGATVLGVVNGDAIAARAALQELSQDGKSIDAIAATVVAARWSIYDPSPGRDKIVSPRPYYWPDFLKLSNLLSVANQTAIYAIVAIGMTMVIITAGIDLSVGSLIALASVCAAAFIRDYGGGSDAGLFMLLVGCGVGIGICALSGAFVGTMVTWFRLPAFIVTLAMMLIARGLAQRISEGRPIDEVPATIKWLVNENTLGLPNAVWLMGILYVAAHVVMTHTVFGRHIYAIGGNAEAARLSGIRVERVLIAVYTISGALAGLGGILLTSRFKGANHTYGEMAELEVIAAVVVGGTSLMGGQGRIFGTLIGAFIIAVINNGMNMLEVQSSNQRIVLGTLLLIAVLLDTLKRRSAS